ncbi:MAG TPA: hypothetical protein VFJ82_16920 [Longimicrobium sp.]|nr:hypothetical protein [Longimicrobium sp.]
MHNLNFTAIAIAWLGSSLLALPLLAFTARYGLAPLVESVAVVRAAGQGPRSAAMLEQRLAVLERGLAALNLSAERVAASGAMQPGAGTPGLAAGGSSTEAGADGGHPAD